MRLAVADDLLRDKLLEWLEANSTITEKAATPADANPDAAGEEQAKAKAKAKAKPAKAQ